MVVNVPWANTTYSAATSSKDGLMSAKDKFHLNALGWIASNGGGNGIVHAPLTFSSTADNGKMSYTVNQYDSTTYKEVDLAVTIPAATTSKAGVMSAADKTKLDGYSVATTAEVEALF